MKNLQSKFFVIVLLLCAAASQLRAQEFTTEGKEFWFGFLENTLGTPPDTLLISMSSRFTTSATVSIPLNGWTTTVAIPANTSVTVGIPRLLAMAAGCGTKSPMGCRIVATEKISAYALNFQGYSADASLLIPNSTIGDKYYLNTYRENYSNSRQTQMLVVAAYPNTTIEITPTVATTCGNGAGVPFQVSLNQSEVYFLDAAGDLTGTYVRSIDVGQGCKKFVLLSGSFCTAVGGECCCDHLFDINFYTDSWGKNFILPNLATRGRTRFRVVAQVNGTQVSVNGGPNQNINAGGFYQFDLTANGSLTSTEPVEVMQMSMSGDVDNVSNSDPFMINLGPNEQTLKEITFNTLFNSGNNPNYYVSIITKSNATALLTLDGGAVGGFAPVASNPAYSIASPNIAFGSHTIRSDSGFLAYVYEYANFESFGYSAGANLSNLFARFTYASASFDTVFCPGDTVMFEGIGDPSIVSYEWDFGDGDTAIGKFPKHTYDSLGRYEVKMIILRQNSCDKDTIPGAVNIVGPTVVQVPDDTICIGSSLTITTNPSSPSDTVKWSTGAIGNSITITPPATTSYNVFAVSNKCPGLRDTFTVFVNDPHVNFTTSSLCFGNPIQFNPSVSANNLEFISWNFGDGNTISYTSAILNYTEHTYSNPGTYQVTLAIVDSVGCHDTIIRSISVFPLIQSDFDVNDVCFNGTVSVINNSTIASGNISSQWNWGDGTSIDTAFAPTHVYADTGNYLITYIAISDSGCMDTLVKPVRVYPPSTADFEASDTCVGNAVVFTNNSTAPPGSTYQWDFGDGQQDSSFNPVHIYATSDTFIATLITLTPQGCNDTSAIQVVVFPKPNVAFLSDSACLGDSVTFSNASSISWGTYTVNWSFDDGNSSTDLNPAYLYADTGSYSVSLVLTSDNNCIDSLSQIARVFPYPVAAFTVNDVCNDSTLTPVNSSSIGSGTLSYNWNFGDGGTSASAAPAHNYTTSGTYTIALSVASSFGCVDTQSATATVILGGDLNFTTLPVCEGSTTMFLDSTVLKTGTTVNNYAWTFGDGNTANTQHTSNTYANANTYTAQLVLDFGNNCLDSVSKQVFVHLNPNAAFSANTVCERNYTRFTNQSQPTSVSSQWQFGDSNFSTDGSPQHLYTNDGTYNATLIVVSVDNCRDTLLQSVTVLPVGTAAFAVAPVCFGFNSVFVNQTDSAANPVSVYNWTLGDNTGGALHSPVKRYNADGTYNVQMIASFTNGCADTTTGNAIVYPTPAMSSTSNNVSCFNANDANIVLTETKGAAPFQYSWSNGATTGALNNIPSGIYDVTFIDANGCVDSLSFALTQPDSLSLSYLLDSISCVGLSDGRLEVLVTGGQSPYAYAWSNGSSQAFITKLNSGVYDITVKDVNQCELTRSILLPEPPKFTVYLPLADTIQLGESITLSPTVPYSNVRNWVWSPATALNCVDCENPVSTPYSDIDYMLLAISEKGCRDTAFTRVNVEHTPVIYIPNLFSPNGDGLNDMAMVYANNVRDIDFLIFNRWGEKVYEGHNILEGWNGIYQNKMQDPETYVYVVKVTFLDNKAVTKTGSITLVK